MRTFGFGGRHARTVLALGIFGMGWQGVAVASCIQSSQAAWKNTAIATETATFTATFGATPSQADMDGVIGFSWNAASAYTSLAAIVRFSTAGLIDVRNGAGYAAEVPVSYTVGDSYLFRMVINLSAKTYNVYVIPPSGREITLASNYAFQSQQASTSSLNNWAMYSATGSVSVCNMTVTSSAAISWTPSSLTFGSVTVGGNKTLTVTITASGTANTTISNVSVSGAGFSASGVPMGLILSPGKTATLDVRFAPSGSGTVTGSTVIRSNTSSSPTVTIPLAGSGVESLSHSVLLTWTPSPSTVVGYNLYRGTASSGPYAKLNSSALVLTTYTDRAVTASHTYYYYVTAVNSSGEESVHSSEVSATVP